jgi:hypothetical protein
MRPEIANIKSRPPALSPRIHEAHLGFYAKRLAGRADDEHPTGEQHRQCAENLRRQGSKSVKLIGLAAEHDDSEG